MHLRFTGPRSRIRWGMVVDFPRDCESEDLSRPAGVLTGIASPPLIRFYESAA
ncbi:MAG TPA: hypothetical protein PLN56_00380 [Methanoregulaceae archaeon]|nr:hypothetical protein [Methanoregulaceae archaeon]